MMHETERRYFDAVYRTLEACASLKEPTEDGVVASLVSQGMSPVTAEKLAVLVPLAFGRALISHIATIAFPVRAILMSKDGAEKVCDLRSEPIFLAALDIATEMCHKGRRDLFEPAALFSAEFSCANQALRAGSSLEGGVFAEPRFLRLTYEDWIQDTEAPPDSQWSG